MTSTRPKIPLILLAGGKSLRMQTPKGLLMVHNRPWLTIQIETLRNTLITNVIVVLGYGADRYLSEISWLQTALNDWVQYGSLQVKAVINVYPQAGAFASLQTGLASLLNEATFVLPMDVPSATPAVYRKLYNKLSTLGKSCQVCIPVFSNNAGHPVLLAKTLSTTIKNMAYPAASARLDVILQHLSAKQKCYVPVRDSRILLNLNTPKEWQEYLGSIKSQKPAHDHAHLNKPDNIRT